MIRYFINASVTPASNNKSVIMLLKLVNTKNEAKGTKSFFFEAEKNVNYLPGQFFYFTLPKLTQKDSRGPTRHFTLSSSPTEGKILRITTRIRSGSEYKQTLTRLEKGVEIEGEGPSGTFILDSGEKDRHLFLAGGIGITPFRSMIKYAIDKNLKTPMQLIYSNSVAEEIAFQKELEDWAKASKHFKVKMTITRAKDSKKPWGGAKGRIDREMIKRLVGDISKAKFWLCGPPKMVEAMEKVVGGLKVTSDRVRVEKFTGY